MPRLEIKPLSVNDAWQGKRYKTQKYKKYERDTLLVLPKSLDGVDLSSALHLDICFGFSSSASDIDNPLKPFIDILQKKYGFDDKKIFRLSISKTKVKKGSEFIEFEIKNICE